MADRYFAKIENDEVVNVIVATPEFVATLDGEWVETGGDSGRHYCGKGWQIHRGYDNFHAKKEYDSWYVDENCVLQPPKPLPYLQKENEKRPDIEILAEKDKTYEWDEYIQDWVEDKDFDFVNKRRKVKK